MQRRKSAAAAISVHYKTVAKSCVGLAQNVGILQTNPKRTPGTSRDPEHKRTHPAKHSLNESGDQNQGIKHLKDLRFMAISRQTSTKQASRAQALNSDSIPSISCCLRPVYSL